VPADQGRGWEGFCAKWVCVSGPFPVAKGMCGGHLAEGNTSVSFLYTRK
jgi:hypothetical protein